MTFQISMMLFAAWANGVFAKYGDEIDELTIEKIAELKLNHFHVIQLGLSFLTSFTALYLLAREDTRQILSRGEISN